MSASTQFQRGWRAAIARAAHWTLERVEDREVRPPLPTAVTADSLELGAQDIERSPRWADDRFDAEVLDLRFAEFMAADLKPTVEERWLLGH